MRVLTILGNALALTLSLSRTVFAADQAKYSKSITLSYEVISPEPQAVKPLCTILYHPQNLRYTLSSWTPPSVDDLKSTSSEPTSAPLLRILLPNGSSTVTSLSTFANNLSQHISLWVSSDPDGSVFSASVTSTRPPPLSPEEEEYQRRVERAKARGKPIPTRPKPTKKKPKKGETPKPELKVEEPGPQVKVELIPVKPAPTPKLGSRAPPTLDAQGNEVPQEQLQEKSFFQKYWWVLAIAAVFTLTAGGGEK
jgi:hypothetical protein